MIYFIQADGVGHIKIGFTDADDADVRLATLQTGSPVPLRLIGMIPGTLTDEKDLHRRFAAARAHGEWFKPVAELVALIAPKEPLACDGVEVVEKSVTIRVMTVGRKQFTRTLLNQLPEAGMVIHWDDVVDTALGLSPQPLAPRPTSDDVRQVIDRLGEDVSHWLVVDEIWGWVAGGTEPAPKEGLQDGDQAGDYRWLVVRNGDRLFKFKDFDRPPRRVWTNSDAKSQWEVLVERGLYHLRRHLPGWRGKDQLFIGV